MARKFKPAPEASAVEEGEALPEALAAEAVVEPAEEPKQEAKDATPPGFEESTWSDVPMWRCLKCGETTFDVNETHQHTCKQVGYPVKGEDE